MDPGNNGGNILEGRVEENVTVAETVLAVTVVSQAAKLLQQDGVNRSLEYNS